MQIFYWEKIVGRWSLPLTRNKEDKLMHVNPIQFQLLRRQQTNQSISFKWHHHHYLTIMVRIFGQIVVLLKEERSSLFRQEKNFKRRIHPLLLMPKFFGHIFPTGRFWTTMARVKTMLSVGKGRVKVIQFMGHIVLFYYLTFIYLSKEKFHGEIQFWDHSKVSKQGSFYSWFLSRRHHYLV